MAAPDRPTFVYDGDCAFCSSCARFIERRVPTPARVVPWQHTDLAALGLTEYDCEQAVRWVDASGGPADRVGPDGGGPTVGGAAGPDAIARLLRSSTPVWRAAGAVLAARPVRAVAWPVYRWIARNRDRMPGGTAACALPQEARNRLHGGGQ